MGERWTTEMIPEQAGRTAVVTGANSGLGAVVAGELAAAGATVILACRDAGKGEATAEAIVAAAPGSSVEVEQLDLASLDSVHAFCERLALGHGRLDLLINNAGVMATPRRESADGFELQLATNHLGHFALTGLLLDAIEGRADARVVTVTSTMHRIGRISFDNIQGERNYNRWLAYGQSKLANILFALELERRLAASDSAVRSVAAHPGYAATKLQLRGPTGLWRAMLSVTNRFAQSAEMGALPILYAATEPTVEGGELIGPGGLAEQYGHPEPVSPSAAAGDERAARRLWQLSEELTGVRFDFAALAAA